MAGKKKKKKKAKADGDGDDDVADFNDGKQFEDMTPEEVEYIKKLPKFFHPKPKEEEVLIKFSVKLPGSRQKNFELDKKTTTIFHIR